MHWSFSTVSGRSLPFQLTPKYLDNRCEKGHGQVSIAPSYSRRPRVEYLAPNASARTRMAVWCWPRWSTPSSGPLHSGNNSMQCLAQLPDRIADLVQFKHIDDPRLNLPAHKSFLTARTHAGHAQLVTQARIAVRSCKRSIQVCRRDIPNAAGIERWIIFLGATSFRRLSPQHS
jgi:hypothetical protein